MIITSGYLRGAYQLNSRRIYKEGQHETKRRRGRAMNKSKLSNESKKNLVNYTLMRDRHAARKATLAEAVKTYGVEAQVDMCIEEMSELAKALLKMRRFNHSAADPTTLTDRAKIEKQKHIIEEVADVQIMLEQMRLIYGDTAPVEDIKIECLQTRLKLRKLQEAAL